MKKILTIVLATSLFVVGHAQVHGQTIPALEAREIALSMVGGGDVTGLELVSDPVIGQVYNVVVVNNAVRYEVSINAATGEVFRLISAGQARPDSVPPAAAPAAAPGGPVVQHDDGRRIRRNPFRRNITREQAVQIGLDFLASQGFYGATFRRHSGIDFEWGVWSWEIYFNYFGREIELYIDMHTGAVTNFEVGGGPGWR